MPGIYPGSGVPAADALNTVNADTVNCTDELFYSTSRCQPRFDPAAANAMISEVLNLVNCSNNDYDCSVLTNLCTAVADMVLLNETITTVTGTNVGNQIATYNNEAGAAVNINETITTAALNGAGDLVYTNEAGVATIIPLPDACCMDANSLQFVTVPGGHNLRSTVTENAVPFVANIGIPAQGPCVRPDRLLAVNVAGALITTELPMRDGGFRRDVVGSSDAFPGILAVDPSAPAGTTYVSLASRVSLVNPSDCDVMEALDQISISYQNGLIGNGQLRFDVFRQVNGGGFALYSANTLRQVGVPVGLLYDERRTLRTINSAFTIAPGATLDVDFRLTVEIINSYAVGSTFDNVSVNLALWGGN